MVKKLLIAVPLLLTSLFSYSQIGDQIKIDSIIESEPTGVNYSPWLTDDLNDLVEVVWPGSHPENFKRVDIKLKFKNAQKINKVSLYDYQGSFADQPAYVYAYNGDQKTLLGTFTGEAYLQYINYSPANPLMAEGLIINKFGNSIPMKVKAFGIKSPPVLTISSTLKRFSISSISPSENTGTDYSPWLSDDMNSLIQDNTTANNLKYTDVKINLATPGLINKIVLYDYLNEFVDKPAYIYALNGVQKTLIGVFTGEQTMQFTDIECKATFADAILIHKYGNNIPQKVIIYGPDNALVNTPVEQRFNIISAIPAQYTGMDYSPWLNDNLESLIENVWDGPHPENSKYVDVVLKFSKPGKITKVSLYDYQGAFPDKPAYVYALSNNGKILLGKFTGESWMQFVDINLPEPLLASALVISKFGNNVPQKVKVFGYEYTPDPVFATAETRLVIDSINAFGNTGMNYSSWMNDDLNNLVPIVWQGQFPGNYKYEDVLIKLKKPAQITKLALYDYQGAFADKPAYLYATNGTSKTFIGIFTGESYLQYINLIPESGVFADGIIIHKFGNNIPQKVQIYGKLLIPTLDSVIAQPTPTLVKIPVEAKRWYQVNNITGNLEGLFDGITDQNVSTGYGNILQNFDAWYPLNKGEEMAIHEVKFYDGQGAIEDRPFSLYAVDNQWNRILIATFTGNEYLSWVGPYPGKATTPAERFKLDFPINNIKYLVINSSSGYPNEMEIYGTHKPSISDNSPFTLKPVKLKDSFGVNAFEWDFEDANSGNIDSARLKAMKTFAGIRHYMDWEKLEYTEGGYSFNPTRSGGWNYDVLYETCKAEGIEVLACLKTLPSWMQATYPADQRDAENVPVRYGKDFSDPLSYIDQARIAFQYVARYGSNQNVNSSLLSVNGTPRWTHDPLNVVKKGLNLIKYIECDNERDKWWKGRKGYQTGREYAANLSAFYDGHKNTMGAGIGVKNADPNMTVVMGGLASTNVDYIRAMVDWCKEFRGYNADSTLNLCWDVINYHLYSNDATSSQSDFANRGAAPEVSKVTQVAKNFLDLAHKYVADMPVWVTETGYDLNQGSPLKAIPIGDKTPERVQADWILRTSLLYARNGIAKTFLYQTYDDNFLNPMQFASSGLLNQNKTRKIAADFVFQVNKKFGEYTFKESLQTDPVVDRYEFSHQSVYVMYVPDEQNRTATYTLNLGSADSALVYTPTAGIDSLHLEKVKLVNGSYTTTLTETPIFVKAIPLFSQSPNTLMSQSALVLDESGKTYKIKSANDFQLKNNSGQIKSDDTNRSTTLTVYPNPTADFITLTLSGKKTGNVKVMISEIGSGKVIKTYTILKDQTELTIRNIDMKQFVSGSYVIQAVIGSESLFNKIIKLD